LKESDPWEPERQLRHHQAAGDLPHPLSAHAGPADTMDNITKHKLKHVLPMARWFYGEADELRQWRLHYPEETKGVCDS